MTALDSNILLALGSQNAATKAIVMTGLTKAAAQGPMCVCGPVFAELLGLPGRNAQNLLAVFDSLAIGIEWRLDEPDWIAAGLAYQGYIRRRRASSGGLPRLLLTDFLIGAHAMVRGYTLITLDKRLYNAAYPGLKIEIY